MQIYGFSPIIHNSFYIFFWNFWKCLSFLRLNPGLPPSGSKGSLSALHLNFLMTPSLLIRPCKKPSDSRPLPNKTAILPACANSSKQGGFSKAALFAWGFWLFFLMEARYSCGSQPKRGNARKLPLGLSCPLPRRLKREVFQQPLPYACSLFFRLRSTCFPTSMITGETETRMIT